MCKMKVRLPIIEMTPATIHITNDTATLPDPNIMMIDSYAMQLKKGTRIFSPFRTFPGVTNIPLPMTLPITKERALNKPNS